MARSSVIGFGGEGEDFAPFPLSTKTAQILEGKWEGDLMTILILGTAYDIADKPAFFIEIQKKETLEKRVGVLFYDKEKDTYLLQILKRNITVPLSFYVRPKKEGLPDIFGECKNWAATLKLSFRLDDEEGEVSFTRERCM